MSLSRQPSSSHTNIDFIGIKTIVFITTTTVKSDAFEQYQFLLFFQYFHPDQPIAAISNNKIRNEL